MPGVLPPALQQKLRQVFGGLRWPVTLVVFTKRAETGDGRCDSCDETRQLAEELASISGGNVRVETFDLDGNPGEAIVYGIDKAPAIAVLGAESGKRDFGIRFYGVPAGYEFGTLIEDIRMVSGGAVDLTQATIEALSGLTAPLHVQVFVTPTCPYCVRAVLLAHKMAMVSDWVTADAVDATEFPELADRYQVFGVPRTVVNETVHVEGAVPEAALMGQLRPMLDAAAAGRAVS